MDEDGGRVARLRRGWRRVVWTLVSFFALMLATVVLFPRALINQEAAARLTEILVAKLGTEAICGDVEIGWRYVRMWDIVLPLDDRGSRLSIRHIDVGIDPLIVFAQPGTIERVFRSVHVVGPELTIAIGGSDSPKANTSSIPDGLFELLARTDSLHALSFENGQVLFLVEDSVITGLRELRGYLSQAQAGEFRIESYGRGGLPVSFAVRVDGSIFPAYSQLDITASFELSDGELDFGRLVPVDLSSNGGEVVVRLQQSEGNLDVSGRVQLSSIEAIVSGNSYFIPDLSLLLEGTELRADEVEILGRGFSASLHGSITFADSLRLKGSISALVDSRSMMEVFYAGKTVVSGSAQVSASISGTARLPLIHATVASESLIIGKTVFRSFLSELSFAKDSINVLSMSCGSEIGRISGSGVYTFGANPQVESNVTLVVDSMPDLFGSTSTLQRVDVHLSGGISAPIIEWIARDSSDRVSGNGKLRYSDSAVTVEFADASGRTGGATVTLGGDFVTARVQNLHTLVPIAYPALESILSDVQFLNVYFAGDEASGYLEIDVTSDLTSSSVVSEVLSELQFNGGYARQAERTYELNGAWKGKTGRGDGFFGRGVVMVREKQIEIVDLYIDEAGLLSGFVSLDPTVLDLQLSIDALPLAKMPIVSSLAEKWNLLGLVSGELTVDGKVDSLDWFADLSLIEGKAQGLPGYWGLLTLRGRHTIVDSLHFTFGRGVRSIIEMEGNLDLSSEHVDLRASFPTSECSDFIQALTGRGGLVSGQLEGDVLITGSLKSPEVLASMRVTNGELFGELTIDRLAVDATLTTEPDGTRLLAIPQLSFSKADKYRFYAEMMTVPVKGGKFQALLEGQGDFLDLLQQVDADFTSAGSNSSLRIDFGGTWDRPEFRGGRLEVNEGKFTYPPAAPGILGFNANVILNADGNVSNGFLQVDEGADYLRLDFLPSGSKAVENLSPLVIPSPRIELGILHISTAAQGALVRLPGFMKPEWLCRLSSGTGDLDGLTISALDSTRLLIAGDAFIRDGRFAFPFLSYGGGTMRPVTQWLVDRLYEAYWDLDIGIGTGLHYDVEVTGFRDSELFAKMGSNPLLGTVAEYLDHISVDAIVTPTDAPLDMRGSLVDSSLRLVGQLSASSGSADYLDQTFWIESLRADFDETDIFPVLRGRAATYGADSLGRTVTVYLTIYEIDAETNSRIPYGRFEDVTYVLEADGYADPEQVLALLGYDLTNLSQGKATKLLTRTAMSAAKRIWLDPISRRLERATFLDQISLSPGGGPSASMFRAQRENVLTDTLESEGFVRLLRGSHVTVGKYLYNDVFVTYTGELSEASGEAEGGRLGLIHYWNLQYRVVPLSRDFVLDFAVEYDEASRRRDESVALKYSFTLEP